MKEVEVVTKLFLGFLTLILMGGWLFLPKKERSKPFNYIAPIVLLAALVLLQFGCTTSQVRPVAVNHVTCPFQSCGLPAYPCIVDPVLTTEGLVGHNVGWICAAGHVAWQIAVPGKAPDHYAMVVGLREIDLSDQSTQMTQKMEAIKVAQLKAKKVELKAALADVDSKLAPAISSSTIFSPKPVRKVRRAPELSTKVPLCSTLNKDFK